MAPKLSEEEVDDLIYLARAGEEAELDTELRRLAEREGASSPAEILAAARDEPGATCLHMAAANGHSKTVTLILSHLPTTTEAAPPAPAPAPASAPEQGATSTGAESGEGGAAAAAGPAAATVTVTPANYIDAANEYGNTALHWACLGGHLDAVRLLLSRGASPTSANSRDEIPLDLAAFNAHNHVVEHFLSRSRDIEGENAGGLAAGAAGVQVDVVEEGGEGGAQS